MKPENYTDRKNRQKGDTMSSQKPQEIDFFEKEVKMTPPSRQDREGTYNFIFPFNNFNNKFMYPRDADVRNFKPFSDLKIQKQLSSIRNNHNSPKITHRRIYITSKNMILESWPI